MALARSLACGNSVTTMPSVPAEVTAPPTPWTNRETSSVAGSWETPHSSEAAVNRTSPATKTRLRPMRSPSLPESRRRPPKGTR